MRRRLAASAIVITGSVSIWFPEFAPAYTKLFEIAQN
jgi:hypothetical protein